MMKVLNLLARWRAVSPVVLLLALLGCRPGSDSPAEMPPAYTGETSSTNQLKLSPNPETLQPGDTLYIVYNDLPQATPPFQGQIKADGTVTLILNQTFQAAGSTRGQLEKTIRDRYVPAYFRDMTVTITPANETRLIYVGGDVNSPGRQLYMSGLTVLKAIQSAGDFTPFANKRKVELTRSGARKPIIINAVKAQDNSTLDLEVYPGDRIHVPRRVFW